MTDVSYFNLSKRFAVLADDTIVPITNLLDDFGDEVFDEEDATGIVCGGGAQWFALRLDAFEQGGLV